MTFDEYYKLTEKYGIEVDADLYLCYRNYLLGRIEVDSSYEDPNRHVTFVTYETNGKPLKLLNPIAVNNLIKNRILDIKKHEIEERENSLKEDFV